MLFYSLSRLYKIKLKTQKPKRKTTVIPALHHSEQGGNDRGDTGMTEKILVMRCYMGS